MKKRSHVYQIYSEFFVGLAIAWFSGGVIAILFSETVSMHDLVFTVESLVFTGISLASAIDYRGKI